jgi:glycine dehydrogenase subunit 1
LAASVAMTALGKQGVKEMAKQNVQKSAYLKKQLTLAGVDIVGDGPTFNEFVINCGQPVKDVNRKLLEKGMIGGFDLGSVEPERNGQMLVCVTELRTKEELDFFANEMGALV